MLRKSLKFLFFLFLVLSFLSFGQFILADEPREGETQDCGTCGVQTYECGEPKELNVGTEEFPIIIMVPDCDWSECDETPEPDDEDDADWYEYRCQGTGCGQQYIERRYCSKERNRSVECKGNGVWEIGTWSSWTTPSCDAPSTIEQCDLDWQLCSGNTDWTRASRSCDCAGTCLEAPENPRYYNNPNYPTSPPESYEAEEYQPEESEDSNNIFLPVKLDWDNTKAWKNGWREEEEGGWVLKECSEDCFQSYLIEIDNTATGDFSKALTEDSEYSPSEDQNACFLRSDTTHNWEVSACCSTDGTNCSPKSNWGLTTNSAPEPISPEDPDWVYDELAENVFLPVNLKWCQVETIGNKEVLSYSLTPYLIENEDIICHPTRQSGAECLPILVINPILEASRVEYINQDMSLFTKLTSYAWQVAACEGGLGGQCGEWSQIWKFETGEQVLEDVELVSPANNETVGFPITLRWRAPPGANSFQYQLYRDSTEVASGLPNPPSESSISFESLELNTEYKWRVMPCKDFEGEDCKTWPEEWWYFKTTGAPPELSSPRNNAPNVSIPIKLDWESVSGAKSYKYLVSSKIRPIADGTTSNDFVLIKYNPDLEQPEQEVTYSWQVATCADEEGEICGPFADPPWEFTTFRLSSPSNLLPEDDETIFTYQMPKNFSWGSSAKYFKFIIQKEGDDCLFEKEEKIITNNSYFVSLSCLGEYQWQVQACLDENCNEQGEPSTQSFILDQTTPPAQFGLVPCGRSSDNPDTPWNERNSCQFKHLFILLRNILDFLLWRVTLIILLLLVIATAIIFYFSIGAPALIIDIRGVWRAAGKGYAIIFLSWIIINLVLNILGYQVGIFGQWWQINF